MIQLCHFLNSWLRLPDENPFFQEIIFIWHFETNLMQNTNSQDDNDSNAHFRIVYEWERQKLCEQWPKCKIFWRDLRIKSWDHQNIWNLQHISGREAKSLKYGTPTFLPSWKASTQTNKPLLLTHWCHLTFDIFLGFWYVR